MPNKKSSKTTQSAFTIGQVKTPKRGLVRGLIVVSVTLNVLTVLGLLYVNYTLDHAATSKHSQKILRNTYYVQSQYCTGEGYEKLLRDAAADAQVSGQDPEERKIMAAASICQLDYPSGKPLGDPSLDQARERTQSR